MMGFLSKIDDWGKGKPDLNEFEKFFVKKASSALKDKMSGAALRFNPTPPTEEYKSRAESIIPGRVRMFSGCMDKQTSADVFDVTSFGLPPVSESDKAGGACTNGLLSTLANQGDITYGALLIKMREVLKERKYTQIPQLSSAQNVKLNNEKFTIWNPEGEVGGPHKALLIGINYVGQTEGVLSGSVNDVKMMRDYIQSQGFKTENISILADDEELSSVPPTGAEIVKAIGSLVNGAKAGDSLFFHYSGHGGQVKDQTGDELDGMDETLIPVDYQTNGQITDDTIFQLLVGKLPAGVSLTCVFDCCRSGTIMDLPFIFSATEESCAALEQGDDVQMSENPGFNFDTAMNLIMAVGKGVFNQVLKNQKEGRSA
eukprot:Tbor_TRINITY_DN5760_c1_g2::TRINITY_DN5760_c1_g2_i5::g.20004::m.20004